MNKITIFDIEFLSTRNIEHPKLLKGKRLQFHHTHFHAITRMYVH